MNRTPSRWIRSVALALATCLGLGASVQAQGALSEQPAGNAALGQVEHKIDPRLRSAAQKFSDVRAGGRMRVVIELATAPADPPSTKLQNAPAVPQLAQAVLTRQVEFLDDLERSTDLPRTGVFELIDVLTLQYSVVAYVKNDLALAEIAARPDVAYVWLDQLNKALTDEGREITGSALQAANGHTGAGVGVAVIDSHFDLLHPELGGSTSLPNGIVHAGQNFSDPGTSIHSRNFNDCYHGTGTASIVRRYAPGVDLYCHTVFPNAFDSVIANAINWCVTNKNGANGGAPIRIISMSLGGGRHFSACNSGTMHSAAGTALSNGILVFAASGNDGWTDSMGSPACSSNVISIGATWDANNAPYSPFPPANCSDSSRAVDERTCYSDTASFLDLYAPSEEVLCALCGGGTFALGGTSSACPAAAGLTAQLLDATPSLIGDKSGVVSLYQSTGVSVLGDASKRRIDLTAALGGGGGGGGATALANGQSESFSLATGQTVSFTIAIPANASDLNVSISGSGDADLYVKRAPINWPADKGSHNEPEFKAPYIGGSNESVDFASPAADTWNVLIEGYTAASGSIVATWTVGGGGGGPTTLQDGVAQSYSVATGSTVEYLIPVPANATSLSVTLTGSGDADLYVKRLPISWPGDQGSHNEAEFKAPYIGGSAESVSFTNPAQDTWHVLIHGYSGNPTGTVTADWEVASSTPSWHYEGFVRQTPHNYSNNSTYNFSYSVPGATQVAVHFATLNTEANYDFLRVYDAGGALVHQVSGNLISGGSGSAFGRTDGWVVVQGNALTVELVTDYSVTRYGYLTDQAAAYY